MVAQIVSDQVAAPRIEEVKLRQCLLQIPPNELEVLLLGYFEGLSSSEIAQEIVFPWAR